MEEVAGARPLHDVRSGEASHLAEAVVAVDDGTVLHPGIGYHKFPVCVKREKYEFCMYVCMYVCMMWDLMGSAHK